MVPSRWFSREGLFVGTHCALENGSDQLRRRGGRGRGGGGAGACREDEGLQRRRGTAAEGRAEWPSDRGWIPWTTNALPATHCHTYTHFSLALVQCEGCTIEAWQVAEGQQQRKPLVCCI
jgi:hypothetical protein